MELYRCQSSTDFEANEVKLYRVNIDSENSLTNTCSHNYFEVNSLEIRPGVRIVDIRSLRGHITIDFDVKDEQLKKLIMDYLTSTDNVELINILSREYNGYNWFEVYDNSYNSNVEYSKEQLLKNENSSHPACAGCEQIVNPLRFLSSIRDKSNHIKPNALYAYIHKGLPRNLKLDLESLDFIPVWYINGAQKARADTCELFCCFEILIHILAKRFVEFKAKLLQLASTDIQLAKTNNQSISRYQHLTQLQLIQEIEKLEAEKKGLKKENKSLEETIIEINTKLDASAQREQELLIQSEIDSQFMKKLIDDGKKKDEKIKKLLIMNKKSHQDIDTLHNMVFGISSQVSDVQRTLKNRDNDIKYLTKAAGFAVHEMKKQTIAKSRVDSNTDIMVLYRTAMKPASDDIRAQATDTQMWLGSYNGDIENYKPNKLPADYDEIYYIESNRLNSFKYLLSHEAVEPFIVRVYQRSILIEEDNLEEFINAVDHALNENKEFKSIINLENAKAEIEAKKAESKIVNKERDLKSKILKDYSPIHVIVNHFKRLVYCYVIDEGKEVLTPLTEVDREYIIKAKWFYRYGTGGKYVQELTFASIEKSSFSKHGDGRIRYEN